MSDTHRTHDQQDLPLPAALRSVERVLGDLRRGTPVVVQGRQAAFLVQAAEGVSREGLARLRALSRRGPVLALSARRAQRLGLAGEPTGAVRFALAGGVTAEAVQQMADPLSAPPEPPPQPLGLSRVEPGGLDAGAVELTKLAGLLPAAVIAPVPGERLSYLSAWAAAEGLLIVELDDVFNFREAEARSLRRVSEARVPLADAEDTRVVAFRPPDGSREHLAIVIGDPQPEEPVLARIHSECFTGDLLASLRCDCGDQLRGAVAAIVKAGGGVLLYLAQEGRGIGLVNKLRAYALQDSGLDTLDANEQLGFDPDERLYLAAAEILRRLGFEQIRLMTNNPNKMTALTRCGIRVVDRVPHTFPTNPHNAHYVATKRQRGGHML
ncbi:MAG: GTP cyclohydrolase II [Alphaproteobacteria bacterium]